MRRRRKCALALLALALLACGGCVRREPEVFPGAQWEWKAPEEAGFSTDRLKAVGRKLGGNGCIVHGGRMIYAWGDASERLDAGSSIKPIYAHLVMKAVESGRIASLDSKVAEQVPEIGELNAELGYKDREITYRHLLNHLSGYGLEERPGEAFAYNDHAVGLLAWTVFRRVYGKEAGKEDELLNGDELGAAIGFEDRPTAEGKDSKPMRISISARDMARFALLYARGGRWGNKQALRADLHREAMGENVPIGTPRTSGVATELWGEVGSIGGGLDEKDHLGCYNGYWWFNRRTTDGKTLLPDVPKGAFFGSGWGGRALMLGIPEEDLVVAWLYVRPHERKTWTPFCKRGRYRVNEMLGYLLEARTGKAR